MCGGTNIIVCVCVCVCAEKGGEFHFSKAQELCMPTSVLRLLLCICREG